MPNTDLEKFVVFTIIDLLQKEPQTIKYLSYIPQLWRLFCTMAGGMERSKTFICGDHEKRISAELCSFYESGEFCDIVLIAGKDNFRLPAHRMILSASSEFFQAMFRSNLSDAKAAEITFEQWDGEVLKTIVDFMYTPRIDIMNGNVENILKAADYFQVPSMVQSCCTYMKEQLDTCNCLRVLFFAKQYNYLELLEETLAFTNLYFEQVTKEQEFLEMSDDQLSEFLVSDEIRVSSEKVLLHSVVEWIKYDPENRQNSVSSLLKHIRFPLLEPKHILEHQEYLCRSPECSSIILHWLQYLLSPQTHIQCALPQPKSRKSCKKLYFIDGSCDFRVQKFDQEINEWSTVQRPQPITKRKFFAACVIDNLFILGGGDSGGLSTSEVECLDIQTMTWNRLPPMSIPRRWFSMAELNGYLYAMGGTDLTWTNSVEKYDLQTKKWTQIPPMNSRLTYPRSTVLGGVIYVICGESCKLECYDPLTNKWATLPSKNEMSKHFALGAVGGYLYAIGGIYNGSMSKTVERFDPRTRKWSKVSSLKVGRMRIAVASINNKLFACGGFDGLQFAKTVEEYDPESNKWTQLAPLNYQGDGCSYLLVI